MKTYEKWTPNNNFHYINILKMILTNNAKKDAAQRTKIFFKFYLVYIFLLLSLDCIHLLCILKKNRCPKIH
jgi:hypothetical protein